MPELMPPQLNPAWGEHLTLVDYKRDFRQRKEAINGQDSWRLERRQHFDELDLASRDALRRGEWEMALELMEEERAELRAVSDEHAGRGSVFRRAPDRRGAVDAVHAVAGAPAATARRVR